MAEKIVKGVDIVEKGALSEHIEQAKQLLVVYSQLDVEVKSTAANLAKISKGFKATKTGDIGNAKAASDNMTKAMLEQERIAQAQIRTKKALLQLEKAQEQQANKNAKAVKDEGNAYKQLTAQTNAAQAELKRLATVFGVNSKEAKNAQIAFDALDKKLTDVNKLARDGRRDVGRYADKIKEAVRELYAERDALQSTDKELRQKIKTVNKGSKEYNLYQTQLNQVNQRLKVVNQSISQTNNTTNIFQKSITGLTNVLGKLGLAMGAGLIARDAFNTIIEFDERLADIAKTTGLTIEGARELSNELMKIDTRTSVDALQEMAVAAGRLGIQGKENIVGFVNAADKSFVALGDDLGGTADEIATSLGKVSAVFGDEAKFGVGEAILKTGSALNELSANSKASAGNILDFTNRMAGVASVAGIAQTDIQALGAFFDDAGQSIEVAATTLNVLLPELAKDQERFAKVAGLTAEEFGAMLKNAPIEALKAVAVGAKSSEGGLNGLVQTLEGFGIEAARGTAIVGTLANGVDQLTTLQGISNEAFEKGTSLTDEFNIKNQTTAALLEKLKKEWDKQILGIGGTTKASDMLKGALQFLIKNLGTILTTVFQLGKAFVIYKATVLAVNTANKVAIALNTVKVSGLKSLFIAQKSATAATIAGETAQKGLNTAMRANPIGLVISGLVTLASLLIDFGDSATYAADAQEDLNTQIENQIKLNQERAEKAGTRLDVKGQSEITDQLKAQISEMIALGKTEDEIRKKSEDFLRNYYKESGSKIGAEAIKELPFLLEKQAEIESKILAINQKIVSEKQKASQDQTNLQKPIINGLKEEENELKKLQLESSKLGQQISVLNENQKERYQLSKELDDLDIDTIINDLLNEQITRKKAVLKETKNISDELSEMAKLEAQLSKLQLERSNLIIKQGGKESDRTLELKIQERELKKQIDRYKEIIEQANKLERVAPRGIPTNGATMTTQEQADKMVEDARRKYEYFQDQKKKKEEQRIADQIQLAQDLTDITTFLVDKRIEAIDREIEAEKRKYEESKQRQNEIIAMRELDSNSLADSLAFEKKEQAKALAEQEKLQRRKQRLELLNTSIGMLNAQIAAGNGDPLAKTMVDITTLIGFIKSLPMFWEGTDTTVGDAVGTKFSNGRDGILARVDKSEMILNKSKVDKLAAMGIHSTDEVVKRLMLGNGVTSASTSMVTMNDNSDVVAKLDEHSSLLKQLVNKPTTSTTMEQMGSVVTIVEKMSTPKKTVETIKYKKVR